ncbi:class I SAM-dependent methyltransferase [Methanobrevibacter sp.]
MEHEHHGKSSANFLDADEILSQLNLEGNETFMDAGCGDGYISKKAIEEFLPDGKVYAIDVYSESVKNLKEYATENEMGNLMAIQGDLTQEISGIDDESVDVILMLNVFHGFKASGEMGKVIEVLKRLCKVGGRIAVMDFKPIEMPRGPPIEIRCSHAEVESLFEKHGFRKHFLNVDIGESIPEGKSHFLIIFEKE